jgi:hypothetical protein
VIYDHIIKRNGKFYAAGEEVPDLISGTSKGIQDKQRKTEKGNSGSKTSRRKQE